MTDTLFNNKLPWRWVSAEMRAQFRAHTGKVSFLTSPANETWSVVSPIWDHNTIYRAVPLPEPVLTQDTINWEHVAVGYNKMERKEGASARLYSDHGSPPGFASYVRGTAPTSIVYRPGFEPEGETE